VEGGSRSAIRGVHVVVGQEHRDPPCEQWLAGLEAGAMLSLGRFALSCVSVGRVG